MKKLAILTVVAMLAVFVAGCGGGDETNGNGTEPTAQQWAAYAFDTEVTPASGSPGTVKSFTIEQTYDEEGVVRQFSIEGEYLGKVTTETKTVRTEVVQVPPATDQETVSEQVECYRLQHRITVLRDDTGGDNPEWADVTVWIPADDFETTLQYFWIYPKATYVDSDENQGEWSYYLTQEMQDEMDNAPEGTTITFAPYVDGEFYGFDEWTLWGLYGWAWTWFSPFATGAAELEEVSWSIDGVSYSVDSETKSVGGYSFDAWSINITWSGNGETAEYSATISPDLPLPIYLKVGSKVDGGDSYFEYELTDIVLE